MAEFKLGRLKFVWKGVWADAATYIKDDIVSFGGKSYTCVQGHVADANFYNDVTAGYWELMADGVSWQGSWATSTEYKIGDIVSYGGKTYVTLIGHTSQSTVPGFYTDLTGGYWELIVDGVKWTGTWSGAQFYKVGDIARVNGKTYIANDHHTSSSTFEADTANWDLYTDGIAWRGAWIANRQYELNDLVSFGGGTYICNNAHESAVAFSTDEAKWDVFNTAFQFENSWDNATEYQIGDVVSYGGYTYVAIAINTNDIPTESPSSWEPFLQGINFRESWNPTNIYSPGDVVLFGGNTYLCYNATDSTHTPENSGYWHLFVSGLTWLGNWADATDYRLGQVVKYGASSYICISYHTSDAGVNDPSVDITNTYWETLVDGAATAIVTTEGDMIYRDSSGVQRLPIGTTGDVLTVVTGNPAWSSTADLKAHSVETTDNIRIDPTGVNGGILAIGVNAEDLLVDDSQYVGYVGLTDTSAVMVNDVDSFVQVSLKNKSNGAAASTDLIVYADNGDNDSGWMDMGITSSGFDVTSGYGITDINDGYIFMSAPVGTTGPGNLVIATNDTGTENDIVFCTGGFDSTLNTDAEKMRIIGEARMGMSAGVVIAIDTESTSADTGALRISGGVGVQGSINLLGELSADGGAIYQGKSGTGITAKDLINDYLVNNVESEVTTLTHSTSTFTLTYTTGTTFLSTAVINDRIEIEGYTGSNESLINHYHTITAHDTGTRQITFTIATFPGSGTITLGAATVRLYKAGSRVGLTNASGVFTGDADSFVQFALKNHNNGISASTDIIAYASDGDNESGWIDMGITSETYNDSAFGVTGPNDGYIFMKAPTGTSGHGNLFLSTAETGTQNDIVFSTGGFSAGNERMRIVGVSHDGMDPGVEIYSSTNSTSTTTGALRIQGGLGLLGNLNVGGNVSIVGTISIGGAGSALETTTLAVSDPMIKMGTGNAADIIDLGFYGTYSSTATTISGGTLTSGNTTITVVSTASFPSTGNIIIGSEEITYTGKTGTTFTGCTRGANGTTAAEHLNGVTVFAPNFTGLVRDASDGVFKLFSGLNTVSPTSTVNFSASGLAYAGLRTGALTAGALTATSIDNTPIGGTTRAAGAFTTLGANSTVTISGATTITNTLNVQQVVETLTTKTGATGVVTHDYTSGAIFYHSSIAANFTANLTNVPTTADRAITFSLILNQGGTGYYPSALQVDSSAVTIRWVGGTTPTPSTNKIDTCVFTLIRTGATWYALGDYTKYA